MEGFQAEGGLEHVNRGIFPDRGFLPFLPGTAFPDDCSHRTLGGIITHRDTDRTRARSALSGNLGCQDSRPIPRRTGLSVSGYVRGRTGRSTP
jgi:hypothetical protein